MTKIYFCVIGEIVSLPLPRTITSIWPLPFGLLLQQEVEATTPSRIPFSSTSPLFSARDILLSSSGHIQKGEGSLVSSHLILMDPLDEEQVCYNSLLGCCWDFVLVYILRSCDMFTAIDSCSGITCFCLINSFFCNCSQLLSKKEGNWTLWRNMMKRQFGLVIWCRLWPPIIKVSSMKILGISSWSPCERFLVLIIFVMVFWIQERCSTLCGLQKLSIITLMRQPQVH